TSVLVTHDQEEALEVADRVAVMNEGHIEQIGSPDEVYDRPTSPFVYNFLGSVNIFRGRLGSVGLSAQATQSGGGSRAISDRPALTYVRPHDITLTRSRNGHASIAATVKHISAAGPVIRIALERKETGEAIEAEISRDRYRALNPKAGEEVFVQWEHASVFDDYSI
ncbi:MAG: TOBE-like domain-containing protein, partial [Bacillota bacterium]